MDGDEVVLRPAAADELERLREVEAAAGAPFAEVGMPDVAADEPPSIAELEAARAAGHLHVAAPPDGTPVAYVWTDVLDGCTHVEQVSVAPEAAGRRLGSRLLDHVAAGGPLTLTTFRDVPWNAPYYRRLGFRELGPDEIGPELRARVDEEAARGLDPAARVVMRRS